MNSPYPAEVMLLQAANRATQKLSRARPICDKSAQVATRRMPPK